MKSKVKIGKMLIYMIFLAVMICMIPTKGVHAVVHDGTTPEGFNYLKSMGCVYISGYEGTETDIEIPEYFTIDGKKYTVIGIWNGAFSPSHADVAITSVTIPDTVQFIQPYAFSSTNIKTITIPKSVTSINVTLFVNTGEMNMFFSGDCPQITGSDKFMGNVIVHYDPSTSGWDSSQWASQYQLIPIT